MVTTVTVEKTGEAIYENYLYMLIYCIFVYMKADSTRLGKWVVVLLQVLLWSGFYLLLLLYTTHKWDNASYGILNASIAMLSYMTAVYGHAYWLLPAFMFRDKKGVYIAASGVFVTGVILLRMALENAVLMPLHRKFYDWQWAHFSFTCVTVLIAFLFGALLRISLNYIQLLRWKKELQQKQAEAELNLLKAQVQPHFLFNTLNNIYALAQSRSEQTPAMIAQLSELMRYFIEEAPKEKVCLMTELSFIKSYIELEQIRMVYPVTVKMIVADEVKNLQLPPMLLMPFVENVFKHGVDKLQRENKVDIEISKVADKLQYIVSNSVLSQPTNGTGGFGLENLHKRLQLLYSGNFVLQTQKSEHTFSAELLIPVHEN